MIILIPFLVSLHFGHSAEVTSAQPSPAKTDIKSENPGDKNDTLRTSQVFPTPWVEDGVSHPDVYRMGVKGQYATFNASTDQYEHLSIFCYPSVPLSISLFWSSASLKMDLPSNNYNVYLGPNVTTVVSLAQASDSAWFYSQLPWRSKEFKLSPFEDTCIGVQTKEEYTITLQWKHVNYMMVAVTMTGLAIFWMAPTLCRNTFFHYTTGISLGLLMSIVLLTYLAQRRFKQSLFSWVGMAYSLSVYLMTRTWFNIKEYLTEQYIHLVIGYVLVAGIISFTVVYRMGPPSNPRTINLIQWSMQFVSLVMVVMSSYHQPASLLLSLTILLWSAIPASLKSGANTQIRKRFFKPQIKLLSEDDYNTQAHEETRKALEQLKAFCRSPESKPWQTVARLRTPGRFAEFIEGSPHLTEAEVMEYSHWDYNTDDEDGDDIYTDDEEADVAASDDNRD
eukprot:GFUD01031478.1.p1 GENE.GFUD01031478.1~~GFUD01031478.1.p1  ORF type:complete len:450 (+),score=145.71 GFUD01031478.1:33-1382(+)